MSQALYGRTIQGEFHTSGNPSSADITVPAGSVGVAVYVGVSGDVEIDDINGNTVVYTAVPIGVTLNPPLFRAVSSGSSTSTDVVVIYTQEQSIK